jgi:Zn-dependent peptidase ImmA (M78 family)/transcriptional regulator with XRE-family HTH domain
LTRVQFQPSRLRLARLAQGLRTNELAARISVTPAAVSQYENGYARPTPTALARLGLALGVHPRFFETDGTVVALDQAGAHFRSLRAASQHERHRALAHAALCLELTTVLECRLRLPLRDVPSISTPLDAEPSSLDAAAAEVRRRWGLGEGPVGNLVRLLEAHGIVVTRLPLHASRVNAFSYDPGTRPVVVLTSDSNDRARARFDAAHELGHVVLHHDADPGDAVLEQQAHRFAAAFLLPSDAIRPELPGRFDLAALLAAKRRWGTSIAALLYRARTLGVMSDASYRRAVTAMSARYGRRQEPGDLGATEQPELLRRAVSAYGLERLSKEVHLPCERISELAEA